eukprot:Seg1278.4 transcript_id=Seg1278.4/GoldUCD/mRNA.D3Y31 product="Cation-dependent mannose-6-phosphate receptor" protein_id=Seg1278.4/GoldUCD/D3Y31
MMKANENALFLGVLLMAFASVAAEKTCVALDQCSCKMTDGKIISLWDIDKRYDIGSIVPGYTFLYRPCTGLKEPNSGCDGALGCQIGASGSSKVAIAKKPQKIDAKYDSGSLSWTFWYTGSYDSSSKKNIRFQLFLTCLSTGSKEPTFAKAGVLGSVVISTLASKCACPGGCSYSPKQPSGSTANKKLSTGSILCIVLVTLIFVYIIAGLVINKYALHKEGSDIIPQKSFWKDVPILVLDGCRFSFSKIKRGGGEYEKI